METKRKRTGKKVQKADGKSMPVMREKYTITPIAILTSDWHLSHKPPVFRSAEPDWYKAMGRPIDTIRELSVRYKCPVLHAGDIFDRWYGAPGKECPELINWCYNYLKFPYGLYAIEGQHDLPEHSYDRTDRSAFMILLNANIVKGISEINDNLMCVHRTLYGQEIKKCTCNCDRLHVMIAHQYKWIAGKSYEGAPKSDKIPKMKRKQRWLGYDVIVFGDNHKSFVTHVGDTIVCNCGAITINKSDEKDYKPRVGLLYEKGHVESYYLDTSEDKYLPIDKASKIEKKQQEEAEKGMKDFAKELHKLGASFLDFVDAWKRYVKKSNVDVDIDKLVREAMDDKVK